MTNSPLVSILIPVYNREKIILKTLNSAISQTYEKVEVIVVDNASTDGTWNACKSFASRDTRIKVFRNETNIGPVRNWKKCIDYATGKYAKILWSDDLMEPTFIKKTLPFLQENREVGFVTTGVEIFCDQSGKKDKAYFIGNTGIYKSENFIEELLVGSGYPVSPGCAIFRRKDLEKNLLINVPNKIGSDFSMHAIGNDALIYLLTAKNYPNFAFVNETLARFRKHNDSITILTDSIKLTILYHIAKAHFVENYVRDMRLRRKFNARLLGICLKNRLKGKYGGITSIKDFYFKDNNVSFNVMYFFGLLLSRMTRQVSVRLNKFNRNIKSKNESVSY